MIDFFAADNTIDLDACAITGRRPDNNITDGYHPGKATRRCRKFISGSSKIYIDENSEAAKAHALTIQDHNHLCFEDIASHIGQSMRHGNCPGRARKTDGER